MLLRNGFHLSITASRISANLCGLSTLCLIANFDVVTGEILSPTFGPTRTEADFAAHLEATIETDPNATWIFVADELNTHHSATLVKLVAKRCGIEDALGIKGQVGIEWHLLKQKCHKTA